MVMASFNKSLLLVLAVFVFVLETEGVALNDSCTINSNCTDSVANSVCEAGFCKCETGYEENSESCNIVTCSASTANNANPNENSIDFGNTVQYTCVTGYEHASGDLTRTCQANGSLTGTAPVCTVVTCSAGTANNANPNKNSIDFGDTVQYTCVNGYDRASGDLTRTCQANGSLTGTAPVCIVVTCSASTANNANPNENSIDFGNTVQYTCVNGYDLASGDLTRMCQANGSLTGIAPVCTVVTCSASTANNANPNENSIDFGNTVQYTCLNGYNRASGDLTRTCQANGSLTGTAPVCTVVTCSASTANNANPNENSIDFGDTVQYTCVNGYDLASGDLTRTCQANGSLTGTAPVCTVVTCSASTANNANPNENSIDFGDTVQYTCVNGYDLASGDLTRMCQANGSLTGTAPVCTVVTCSASTANNANPNENSIDFGNTVQYTCVTGYEHASGDLTRTCQANGSLTGTSPVCTVKTCSAPGLSNGTPSSPSTINYDTAVTYSCNTGYIHTVGDLTRRCNSDGQLTGQAPVCTIKTCSAPGLSNGTPSSPSTINYDTDVTYSCNTGYTHTGDLTRTCNANGQLTGQAPVCTIKTCSAPGQPDFKTCSAPGLSNGTPSSPSTINYDTDVTYSCNTGYTHTGDLTRTCNANGQLTGQAPVCTRITCAAVDVADSSKVPDKNVYDFNTTVTYSCDAGFEHISGDLSRRCEAIDKWTGTAPTCGKIRLGKYGCSTEGSVNSCEDPNAVCNSQETCECDTRYYDNNGASELGSCVEKVLLGASGCTTANGITDSCLVSNTDCISSTCVCKSDYYDDNGSTGAGSCALKGGLGGSCSSASDITDSCSDVNAYCGQDKCICKTEYYDDNGGVLGGLCRLRVAIDVECPTDVGNTYDQCDTENANCTLTTQFEHRCQCIGGYHPEEVTGGSKVCVANAPLGGTCDKGSTDQCSDSEAGCLSDGAKYICTCKVGFYDDNGFTLAGNCRGVSNLMVSVSTISFTKVATKGFTVSWSGPVGYIDHVSSYSVSWSPSNGQAINTGKQTTADLPGLTPGQVYDVTITSQNDVTQVSSPRIVSVTKQQSAKPNTPGPLLLDQCDLNPTNDLVELVWIAPSGKVSSYLVEVHEGTDRLGDTLVQPADGNPDTDSATLRVPNIRNGHRYNVSITARSMVYLSTETVDSDTYTEQIKTVVIAPLEPTGFNCKQRSDEFIVLQWVEPEFPNGDLIQYKILVHFDTTTPSLNDTVYTNMPVTEFQVQNLEPGTYYLFWIYTENENFFSSDYSTTSCKTLDKVSDPPNTLEISDVSNRSMTISWTKPTKSYGEILGYALQLRDSTQKCHSEVFIKCSDCIGTINETSLQRMCSTDISRTVMISKMDLSGTQQQIVSGLLPYFTYNISVAAINEKGEGRMAEDTQRTLEEAPVKPAFVKVESITETTFVVKWTKGTVRPGITNYTVDVISTVTTDTQLNKKIILMGYDQESTKIEGLEEYWDYNVKVTATTSVASVVSDQLETIRTLPTRPGPVDGFNIITGHDSGTYQTLIVEWKIPQLLQRNSKITGYKFMWNDTTENIDERQLTANPDEETYVYRETIDVEPENYYTIEVLAINHKNKSGQSVKQLQQAPAGVPVNIEQAEGVEVIAKDRADNFGQTSFMIPITKRFYNQDRNGKPVEGGLVACAEEKHTYLSSQSTSMTLNEYQLMDNWATASKDGYPCYRPTKKGFIDNLTAARRKKRAVDDEIEFVLGEEDCSADTGFCNGPLAPNTAYIVRLVVCTNGGCLVSKEYGPFRTVPIPPPPSSIGGIVGGAVGGVVAAAVVVGVILFVMHRRRRNFGKSTQKAKELTPTEIHPEIPNRRPVTLDMFPQHVARLHKDSNLLFSAEYDDLKTLSPTHPTTAADEEDNRLKNRYINILPFDQTRVKLQKKTDEDQDFINANYLPGYKSGREYIGCQGPIPATLDDIWRMVWEQNVAVIVMLTLCKEGNKVKCEQYWPDVVGEPKQYGDIVVEMTSTSNIKFYDYRIFKLTYADTTKVIKHFHFLSWLDFQANITHDTILDFISQVRSHVQPPDTAGPMIVHCSAGVGRTGTYICLDHLMQFIADHDFSAEIDIFNMVLKLRENRPHMVQTEQQYVFIHDCVNEILERKRQALMEQDNIYVNQGFDQEDQENLYQNSEQLYQNVQIVGGKQLQKTEL